MGGCRIYPSNNTIIYTLSRSNEKMNLVIRNGYKFNEKVFCDTFGEIWVKEKKAFKMKLNWLQL